jgi:hypothetical protein
MSEININSINERIKAIEATLEQAKAEKANLDNPTIKGLGIKFTDLGVNNASAVIHLHNAILERLEALTTKVEALEAKTK